MSFGQFLSNNRSKVVGSLLGVSLWKFQTVLGLIIYEFMKISSNIDLESSIEKNIDVRMEPVVTWIDGLRIHSSTPVNGISA